MEHRHLVPWIRQLGPAIATAWLVMLVLVTACHSQPVRSSEPLAFSVAPTQIVFHPDTEATEVEVTNRGSAPIVAQNFSIDATHADWSKFSIVEPLNPTVLDPGQSLKFHIDVDAKAFETKTEAGHLTYTPGEGELDFEVARLSVNGTALDAKPANVPLHFSNPSWLTLYLWPALIKAHLVLLGFVLPLAAFLTWLERKESAMMQDRVGPNMARLQIGSLTIRLWGLLHVVTDGIKMLFKEDFVPRRAHWGLYTLAPLMALVPAIVVFAIVPFGDGLCYSRLFDVITQADVDQCAAGRGGTPLQIARIDVGLLFYFAVASLATYGTTLAGWASYNKWAILGALRASAQMISYEVALGLTVVGALLVYGTLEPYALVQAQLDTAWGIWLQPLAFILFFTAAIAETKRAPFDLPEGESEIIGYFVEYSGMRFGLFFLSEFMEVVFVGAMVTTLFLGGWSLPAGILTASGFTTVGMCIAFFGGAGLVLLAVGLLVMRSNKTVAGIGAAITLLAFIHLAIAVWSLLTGWGTALPHLLVTMLGVLTWGLKVFALCWLQLLIRWTLPRFRYDQLMNLGWKGLLPLSIANIVLTTLVVYALLPTGHKAPAAHSAPAAPPTPAMTEIPR